MDNCDFNTLPPWEQLFKRVLWAQLGDLRGKRILDFGSGIGVTACHYAAENEVIAVEPSAESVAKRWDEHPYRQIVGSVEVLRQMEDGSFDVIFCHTDPAWQEKMIETELRVARLQPYRDIAFFHHLILEKK